MKLLFCCELYHPSVGGVPIVMRQIAERLASRGHEITVATTQLNNRDFYELSGVKIVEFNISGNLANGLQGEIKKYQEFVKHFDCDVILIKAAQQWTFDALWPVFDEIKAKKVFIPCGFAALHEPTYQTYYADIPGILRKMDHLLFYSENYRDIHFAKAHHLNHYSIIPNGADEGEFNIHPDTNFRKRYGIKENSFVFLTVGGLTGVKGHLEVTKAFSKLKSGDQPITLILNSNNPFAHMPETNLPSVISKSNNGLQRTVNLISKAFHVYRKHGMKIVLKKLSHKVNSLFAKPYTEALANCIKKIETQNNKQIIQVDLPRQELIQAFMSADLFVFASHIEYSPLVLFETIAAGTPFLSVPVGNAEEIVKWTGGGMICPAKINQQGYTRVKPRLLAKMMYELMLNKENLAAMGKAARHQWQEQFTWDIISKQYEQVFKTLQSQDIHCE